MRGAEQVPASYESRASRTMSVDTWAVRIPAARDAVFHHFALFALML